MRPEQVFPLLTYFQQSGSYIWATPQGEKSCPSIGKINLLLSAIQVPFLVTESNIMGNLYPAAVVQTVDVLWRDWPLVEPIVTNSTPFWKNCRNSLVHSGPTMGLTFRQLRSHGFGDSRDRAVPVGVLGLGGFVGEYMSILGGAAAPLRRDGSLAGVIRSATSLSGYRWQVFAADLVIVSLVCIGSPKLLGFADPTSFPTPLLVSLGFAAAWMVAMALAGAYRTNTVSGSRSPWIVVKSALALFGVIGALAYVVEATPYRDRVLLNLLIGLPLLVVARMGMLAYLRRLRAGGSAQTRVLVVAPSAVSSTMLTLMNSDSRYSVAGVINPDRVNDGALVDTIARRAVNEQVDSVLVHDPAAMGETGVRRLAWELENDDVVLLLDSGVTRFAQGRSKLTTIAHESVIQIDHSHKSKTLQAVKRGFDVVVSAGLLVLVAPLIAVLALAIRLESRGPAFFVQPRVGRNGELFPFFKLRSMRVNAHLERSAELGPTDDGILERYLNDTRITRIGKFIRRWSLDELPQLANVFLGHMSLVGPRPVLVEELHDLPEDGNRVHLAKPGLTGLWQISGRKEIRWEDRIDLDLQYVDGWSLGMDAKILSKTAGAVVKGSGAY